VKTKTKKQRLTAKTSKIKAKANKQNKKQKKNGIGIVPLSWRVFH